jgi:hypothetical protein
VSDIIFDLQNLAAEAEQTYRGDIAEIADGRAVRSSDLADAAATGRTAASIAADVENVRGAREVIAKRKEAEALGIEMAGAVRAREEAGQRVAEARREAAARVLPFAQKVDEAEAHEKALRQRQLELRGEAAHGIYLHCQNGDPLQPKWSTPRE